MGGWEWGWGMKIWSMLECDKDVFSVAKYIVARKQNWAKMRCDGG